MANNTEIKGISFPFRIGGRGRIVMSGRNANIQQHIKENIVTICSVMQGERPMMRSFGLEDLDNFFSDLNETTKNIIAFKVAEAINQWEPRVEVQNVDISEQELEDGSMAHVIDITYKILDDGSIDNTSVLFN